MKSIFTPIKPEDLKLDDPNFMPKNTQNIQNPTNLTPNIESKIISEISSKMLTIHTENSKILSSQEKTLSEISQLDQNTEILALLTKLKTQFEQMPEYSTKLQELNTKKPILEEKIKSLELAYFNTKI